MTNRLAQETSPYLLQHAHNPVDWYPWGEEALQRAKEEDKPILVSIGYAACHWCHVMERESFENEGVAAYMNANFICIKVDREERPDIDQIYMDAVQAVAGQGGWPLNMFLTPEAKPFYGGTYFPPAQAHGRPSWGQALQWVRSVFDTEREKFETQAENLTKHIAGIDDSLLQTPEAGATLCTPDDEEQMVQHLKARFEKEFGGFGSAPKFPNTYNLSLLLRLHYHNGEKELKDHALYSLEQMIKGGIYDQLGGGFSRYSVDAAWLVPHFEKMLYDNALLVELMAQAYKLTKEPIYKDAIEQTLEFVQRELTSPEGAFYAALDADSEGEEGKFYVWTEQEVDDLLGDDAGAFKKYYDVTADGNWEGKNILRRLQSAGAAAGILRLSEEEFWQKISSGKEKLMAARDKRIRPGLDDKVILCWNALMASGYIRAYEALGEEKYLQAAKNNLDFIFAKMYREDERGITLYHTWKENARYLAFLDDCNALIAALLDLYQVTFDTTLIAKAQKITDHVLREYADEESPLCYYTPRAQTDIIFRKKDLYDSVTPSGNSLLAGNLHRLGLLTGNSEYAERGEQMLAAVKGSTIKYTSSFGNWAATLLSHLYPTPEIAVVGEAYQERTREVNAAYLPDKVLMASKHANNNYPLLDNRGADGETLIYLCRNYACSAPVKEVGALLELVHS